MNILMVSSEVAPFAKTGGMADFAGSLSQALKARGHDLRIVTPQYKQTDAAAFDLSMCVEQLDVGISTRVEPCAVLEGRLGSGAVPVYFLKNDGYYRRDHLYGDSQGDYPDNAERFIYFSRTVLEVCKALDFIPDLLHCCDWQTGLVPVYLEKLYRRDSRFAETASLFTIYNLSHQGVFWHYDMHLTGLDWDVFTPDGLEFYGKINLMKGGLLWADILATVSPTYSLEIQQKGLGCGLEGVLHHRRDDLYGVLNGIEYALWSPENDPLIPQQYHLEALQGKSACRTALVDEFSLDDAVHRPVISMASHLDDRKGADLVAKTLEEILAMDVNVIIMGTGQEKFHRLFHVIREKFPRNMGLRLEHDPSLQHRLLAGADILLMPSRYEPWGGLQLCALKYGTIPIVCPVGSLNDSVRDMVAAADGTGFFLSEAAPAALLDTVRTALEVYRNQEAWQSLQRRAMQEDFSWKVSAEAYERLYAKAREKHSG
ncbi:hypothetical protein CSB45_08705 [candidate division KSB3 bacterium]|uniref:Glycogen synthase n=1 Tax=candidate division KSB3 bacterium TaxID=2044937 RepID=A0A2G6E4K3_9BACT|nr:MAG: hypothetical protein CSB45_08705 [candidate division KSB3 bacterium]PIE29699.1 MAG: hypothetical protein CSA57_07730 [candidate division KSB3 bacterium]